MKRYIPFVAYRKVYNRAIKYVVLLFICALLGLCSVYIYFSYSQSTLSEDILVEPTQISSTVQKPTFPGKKYVHLDLKGAPPKISYYEYLFPLLAKSGVAGVVIEYEDTFPFRGEIANISALNAYTRDDIELINILAENNRLDIIPLVQTFGHLEFVLKLEEFKELREVSNFPQVLCPSKTKSQQLVFEMLTQVIDAHPFSSTIHIGLDEIHHIGRCGECTKLMKLEKITAEGLYLKYLKKVSDLIRKKYPLMNILMWDDELRYLSEEEIPSGLNKLGVTLVVWQYEADVFNNLGPSLWNQYSKVFSKVWIASAFKGATGVDQFIVDVPHYNENHRSWMDVVENYKFLLKFEAIILTGWQRYDHFSILCELLPVGLPSLLINLKILEGEADGHMDHAKEVGQILGCKQPYALLTPSFGSPQCSFPGGEIVENVYRLHRLKEDFEELKKNPGVRGWMTDINVHYNVSSPGRLYDIAPHLTQLREEVIEIESDMSKALLDVYDVSTQEEWMSTYVRPLKQEINKLFEFKEALLARGVWPRRPFKHSLP